MSSNKKRNKLPTYVITDKMSYEKRIDEASSTLYYVGWAEIGSATSAAVWRIKKIEKTATVWAESWADDDDEFNNVWDNRAGLSY